MMPRNTRRKRRQALRIQEQDDELPWPRPNDDPVFNGTSYPIPISFNPFQFGQQFPLNASKSGESFSTKHQPAPDSDEPSLKDRVTLESVHQKLNLLLREQSRHSPALAALPPYNTSSYSFRCPTEKASLCGAASSNDVCTLFQSTPSSSSHLAPVQPPPIGVFWDIENCQVPRGKSALVAVQRIRQRFFSRFLEAEFVCVCDIRKESAQVIQELNDAQVSVVHVSGNSKNAADDKLRQAMRRYADVYSANRPSGTSNSPPSVLLISGDINFATDLSDLRYRKRLYVVLLHNKHAPDALILCAHEHYDFYSILENLPDRAAFIGKDVFQDSKGVPLKGGHCPMDVVVTDLPVIRNMAKLKNRLKRLSDNCGGKVVTIQGQFAVIRFPNQETALRASKRMNGEDVFGSKIRVVYSSQMELKNSASQNPITPLTLAKQKAQPTPSGVQTGPTTSSWKPTWSSSEQTKLGPSEFDLQQKSSDNLLHSSSLSNSGSSTSSSAGDSSRDPSPTSAPKRLQSTSLLASQENRKPSPMTSVLTNPAGLGSNQGFCQNLFALPQTVAFVSADHSIQHQHETTSSQSSPQMNMPHLYSPAPSFATGSSGSSQGAQSGSENVVVNPSMIPMNGYFTSGPALGTIQYQHHQQDPYGSQTATCPSLSSDKASSHLQGYRSRNDNDSFDLHVTNIDSNIGDWKLIRQTLMNAFAEHVTVRGIWVYAGQDGSVSAIIRVGNKEEAHYAVAQLHRRNIGGKRIFISFGQGVTVDQATLKKEVAALLQDVPNHSLPLFKFREMFEKRYRRSISASDLYRMKDVITISDSSSSSGLGASASSFTSNGRSITLTLDWETKGDHGLDVYCKMHPPIKESVEKTRQGWAEKEVGIILPNVIFDLKPFSKKVHSMLQSHNGGLPLLSFMDCYESEYGVIEHAEDGNGVPLEHFIACVQGVEITHPENGMKRVQWSEKKELETGLSQAMAVQLAQLSRELVDLLKTFPRCSLPFSKLIPAYHHHFGRQCRVADYGHFSLSALLQTMPLTIQIMGEGQDRIITLAHRAQMKRFATDLLRVLKAQGGVKKHVRMDQFTAAFSQVFPSRLFYPEDYGLCYFTDLVSELIENSTLVALIKDEDGHSYLAIPKREQTAQEIHRTRIFATEVVDLLSHSIRCEMPFSKFIPSYHHHFGRQCRVSHYGFSKLAELFEAIGDTVCICNPNGNPDCNPEDKIIRLTPKEQVKVVGEQVWNLVEKRELSGAVTRIADLEDLFLAENGFVLRPDLCEADDLDDLIRYKLRTYIELDGDVLLSVDRVQLEQFVQDAKSILEIQPSFTMGEDEFIAEFGDKFNKDVGIDTIEKNLAHLVIITEEEETNKRMISLAPLRVFGREMSELLTDTGGFISLSNLETAYLQKFGRPIRPAQLGYPTIMALLQAIPDIISLRGKYRAKRVVVLNKGTTPVVETHTNPNGNNTGGYTRGTRKPHSSTNMKNNSQSNGPQSKSHHAGPNLWVTCNGQNLMGPPGPMYSPTLSSPGYTLRSPEPNVFTFDRSAPISPPMYDMWMRDGTPGSPPMSPPVVWTYHPMGFHSPPPPVAGPNVMMPTFSYGGPWSPPPGQTMMPSGCYEHAQQQK